MHCLLDEWVTAAQDIKKRINGAEHATSIPINESQCLIEAWTNHNKISILPVTKMKHNKWAVGVLSGFCFVDLRGRSFYEPRIYIFFSLQTLFFIWHERRFCSILLLSCLRSTQNALYSIQMSVVNVFQTKPRVGSTVGINHSISFLWLRWYNVVRATIHNLWLQFII